MPQYKFKVNLIAEDRILELVTQGVFTIDSEGRIWRNEIRHYKRRRPLKPRRAEYRAPNGYLRLRVMIKGERYCASAHRIVYRWIHRHPRTNRPKTIPRYRVIDHIDRKRTNNSPGNLEMVTIKENARRRG